MGCATRILKPLRSPATLLALASVGVSALTLGLFAAFGTGAYWGKPKKSSYCEGADEASWVRQKANSWSNLAYVASGGWALGRALETRLQQAPPAAAADRAPPSAASEQLPLSIGALIGTSSVALGLGSFLFHASLTRFWQQADVAAMYWAMNAALAATSWRWLLACGPGGRLQRWAVLPLLAAALAADALMFAYKWKLRANLVFGAQLAVVSVSEVVLICLLAPPARRRQLLSAAFALATGLLGYLFRQLGVQHRKRDTGGDFCSPQGAFQPHALWHVLTGAALFALHAIQLGPTSDCRARWRGACTPLAKPLDPEKPRELRELEATTVGRADV